MKVIFASSEAFPFAKTGGLGDVCGALPLALEKLGIEVAIFLPLYKNIDREKFHIKKVTNHLFKTTIGQRSEVYFIKNEQYFGREGIYGCSNNDFPDNLARFHYFCEQVLNYAKQLDFKPDIIHGHDWPTALLPVYLKEKHKHDLFYFKTKSILTIHNLAYQGLFPSIEYEKLGLRSALNSIKGFEFYRKINLLKAGIIFADMVTTVSPQYAREIQAKQFGCGLDDVLRGRRDEIVGILNGLDYDFWNPQTDPYIKKKYSVENYSKAKLDNKKHLQKMFGLPVNPDVALFGFVARLTHQKGVDLILEAVDEMVKLDMQLIVQGTGDEKYHGLLSELAYRYPKKVAVSLEFKEELAHEVYAGSDLFLMPSQFEPCGLSQMISLRYGTIPLVFKTGGLADTIIPHDKPAGNGFVFTNYKKEDFLRAVKIALRVFKDKKNFEKLIMNAYKSDFSWDKSAKEYQRIYQCLQSA